MSLSYDGCSGIGVRRFLFPVLFGLVFFGAAGLLSAQDEQAAWLGLTPEAAYRDRGAPAEIYPLAVDDKRWQAVHFYADHTYLFWSANRVWEVRLDKLWAGSLKGVTMGTPRPLVETAFGEPIARGDTWSVWDLPYQVFPRRIRLIFTDGILSDAYLYRSDL